MNEQELQKLQSVLNEFFAAGQTGMNLLEAAMQDNNTIVMKIENEECGDIDIYTFELKNQGYAASPDKGNFSITRMID